jgi:hypothetical protein
VEGDRAKAHGTGGRGASRALLAVVALFAVGAAGFVVAIADEVRGWLDDAAQTVLASPGAAIVGGILGLGLAVLAWSLVRPRDGARVAAALPAVAVVAAFAMATSWRGSAPEGGTLRDAIQVAGASFQRVDSAAEAGLFAASLAACVAGLAYALRARAAARAPRITLRAIFVPFAVLGATILALAWVVTTHLREAHVLLLQSAVVGVTALASATALDAEDADVAASRDAMCAASCSVVGMLLGVLAVGVSMSFRTRIVASDWLTIANELPAAQRLTAKQASPYLLPALVAAGMGIRWRADAAKAALREVGGPLLAALVAAVALGSALRGALADVSRPGKEASLPGIDARLVDEGACDSLTPRAVVHAGGGGLALSDGPAGPDLDAAFRRLDARAPDEDVWLAVDADATPFRDTGELLAAAGRARGPRGLGLAAALTDPPRGCAAILVGRAASGAIACTAPAPLFVDGCMPGALGETPLRVSLRDDHAVRLRLAQGATQGTAAWERSGSVAELQALAARAFAERGRHVDAWDPASDRAVLEIAPAVTLRDALSALGALRAVDRPGRQDRRPAYVVSIALAGATSP